MDPMTETKTINLKQKTPRRETPPDFSQFKGERLDKEPSRVLEMLGYAVWFFAGIGILLAMIFSLFYFV
ncbi:hypothetical protein A1A1_09866 [Planococcus antarcticus DSM 14505]|uniref:Uncharacterized protein n=1 Tax=Planococcus antarcticus DSM 14505 TaxID=1185653 RepID=A0A1C7DH59_9BACL|nr:hypothetical protein [Planococcus antarcticus]ANU10747.1 hypothetical protein BBH88_10735 [Planococcus antarcticus DSM 14505]EIM06843.1 hypothetical protein A1A1_09866 [Planococcus antarcticus DSM 14505]